MVIYRKQKTRGGKEMQENNIIYEVKEHLGVISRHDTGWTKELNIVSWNGSASKYDIRDWDPKHERMSRGVTLHPLEMRKLVDLYISANNRKSFENRPERTEPVKTAEPVTTEQTTVEEVTCEVNEFVERDDDIPFEESDNRSEEFDASPLVEEAREEEAASEEEL